MARRKTGDKKVTRRKVDIPKVQADDHSIAFQELHIGGNVSGDIRIGHTIGYTADQVSVLLKQITTTLEPKKFDGRCPYKGLEVFEEEDAELFFGRERLVNELVGRVKESRTVFITGPSGSGKSSLVRAGLIHALKHGKIKSSERWLYETMKPGREPLKDLALAFSRLKSPELEDYFLAHAGGTDILNKCAESVLSGRKDQRFLLFVDQFEEVFTQINSEEERLAFINMLAHAGTVENGRVIILFAMRSDFVSNCATYPALNELLSQEFRQIGAMQPEELVNAIALPAMHVGLPVEHELIAQIINDMKGEPDALPLMQFALKDLFDAKQAQGGVIALTLKDYLQHGGIHKSLERHADATFAKLSESEQELTRSIFSGLIEIGRGTQDTKRTALFDELVPANTNSEEVGAIVQKLADARLIVTDEQAGKDTVTISHEKLIEAWPWLKKLVNENRDAIALQNEIASDAKEWEDHNRDESYLYSGARLANAREQLGAKKIVLSDLSQIFVDTSQVAEEAEQRQEEQRRQKEVDDALRLAEAETKRAEVEKQRAEEQTRSAANLRKRSIYLTGALIAALIAVGAAILFGIQSQQQAEVSRARELAAQSVSLRDKSFQTSLLLGIEAFRLKDNVQTRGALLDAANANPQLVQFLIGNTGIIHSVVFSPNGKMLASGGSNNTIILWDVPSRKPIGQPFMGHTDVVVSLSFSPDSTMLASTSADKTIILWDVASHQQIGQPLMGHTGSIYSIAFSPDGKMLASGSSDATIILWDVASHQPMGQPIMGHIGSVNSIVFSPDGKTLASGGADKTIILWNLETRQQISQTIPEDTGSVYSIAFNPNGKMLASGGDNIILWNLETGQPIGQPLVGHTDLVGSIAFSPDGKTLASGSDDTTIILWDIASHKSVGEPLAGHTSFGIVIAFSPDGKTLASTSFDNKLILWDVTSQNQIGLSLTGHTAWVNSVAFSPDRKTLASGSSDDTIILWDVASRQPIGQPLTGHTDAVNSVAFSPDGKTLASGSADKTIILWDVASRQPIGQPLTGHTEWVVTVAFSPDGKRLASGSLDKTIILWDVASRQPIGQPLTRHTNGVSSVAFSPDGKTFVSGSVDTNIFLWDTASNQPIGEPLTEYDYLIGSLAFSPDGKMLAAAGGDGDNTILLWDLTAHQPTSQRLTGHTDLIVRYSVAFSPDGDTLASAGGHQLILWDVASRQPIGQIIARPTIFVENVAFSPDGDTLVTGGDELILWNLDPLSWINQSCQRAGRNFSRAEWERYFSNETYRKTCERWPLEPEVVATPSPIP